MRSYSCPVCGEKTIQFTQVLRGLIPFMRPDHCRSCGAKVVLAYDVRDNVIVAIILGFILLAAVQKRSPGYSVFLPGSFVFLSIFVWLIYAAKFVVDPAPKYLQYFIVLALYYFFWFFPHTS